MTSLPFKYGSKFPTRQLVFLTSVSCLFSLTLWFLAPKTVSSDIYFNHIVKTFAYLSDFFSYVQKTGGSTDWSALHISAAVTGTIFILWPIILLTVLGPIISSLLKNQNDSRFANRSEVERMGLHGDLGPVLGVHEGVVLKPSETRHVCVIAPTRAGKTRQAISTVLDYPGSIIAIDPKSEIKVLTEDHRSQMGDTFSINWADPNTKDGWNFLSLRSIKKDPIERERQALRFAGVIVPPNPSVKDPTWDDKARLNTGAFILFEMCEALRENRDGHIKNVRSLFTDLPIVKESEDKEENTDPFTLKMAQIAETAINNNYPRYIIETVMAFGQMHAGGERSSHISTLETKFQYFASESSRNALAKDSFQFADLRSRPATVYIDFPQEDAAAFGGITSLFIDSLVAWTLGNGRKEGEYPILILIDEFRDLPFIGQLPSLFTKGAGAGVGVMTIVQSLEQIKERYDRVSHNLLDNYEYFVVFGLPNHETQKMLSAIVGERAVQKKSETKQGFNLFGSNTKSEQREQLIKPSDWGVIPFGHHIVLANRHFIRPIYCKSAFWDQLSKYRRRVPRKNRIKT
ncbi:type IV secretory system conjugative DNA transfer family protein [Kiloniella laminariae]|uniref:Type IV secretory system conjugative DNA transfer family protein n=1 Tax=Kiloniella laminariae TaxID=454162 RepID=A0ABT4LPU5_9PROT|nr:type IV secretory system conjugative DNA transfer family protein [Kiloniella laminariae]MCZ4283112.1 type IV secretory system conjugative DNA transfer family protein [Kiloniella laminariae]